MNTVSTVSVSPPSAVSARPRLESIDVVRGVIMIVMALDHTRDYFGFAVSPTDIATTTPALFFTRWITHFCAPGFFLLTGTGAYLSLKKKSKQELSKFLVTRGLWLIFLELVVTRTFGWQFNFDYHFTLLFILWALGWAMITLSALVFLPDWAIATFGVVVIATHNLFDSVNSANPIWTILHAQNFVIQTQHYAVFVAYPLVPWLGVTALGYVLGRIYRWDSLHRKKFLISLGFALITSFIVLRAVNRYGDPLPWSHQSSAAYTVISFFDTSKYPASLLFLLMTLGPLLLFLTAVDGETPNWLRPALVYGRVPLFYYLLHAPLIHLIAVGVCYAKYGHAYWMFQSPDIANFPFTRPPDWGFSLPVVYLVWASIVIALYPACRWFMQLKQHRADTWLSYL